MKTQPALNMLVLLTGILAFITAAAGLFWPDPGSPIPFTTLHGQAVTLYGQGLYRLDTLFTNGSFRGTDAVTLLIGLPLLVISFISYRRGSLRGAFLLVSALSYFLYNATSMAFGAAYNPLFMAYVVFFSASLFAFILAFTSIDLSRLPGRLSSRLPRRGIAAFLFIAGLVVVVLWLSDVIATQMTGRVPELLASYTTMVTYVIDLAIIAPSAFLAAFLTLRRAALGVLLACILMFLNAMIGAGVIGQTIAQLQVGVVFSPGQLIGMVGAWIVLAGFAIGLTIALLRSIQTSAPDSTRI